MTRTVRLPFVPFVGLMLWGLLPAAHLPLTIQDVGYDMSKKAFSCAAGRYFARPRETMAELVDFYGPEWDIKEPGDEPVEEDEAS